MHHVHYLKGSKQRKIFLQDFGQNKPVRMYVCMCIFMHAYARAQANLDFQCSNIHQVKLTNFRALMKERIYAHSLK